MGNYKIISLGGLLIFVIIAKVASKSKVRGQYKVRWLLGGMSWKTFQKPRGRTSSG